VKDIVEDRRCRQGDNEFCKVLGKNKLNKMSRIFGLGWFDPKTKGHRNSYPILRTFWLRIGQVSELTRLRRWPE
jgi:hypothetical protein